MKRAQIMDVTRLALLLLFLVSNVGVADASPKTCTQSEPSKASRLYVVYDPKVWTWGTLYESFHQFGHCADASNKGIWNAELLTAYDEAIEYLLVHDWQHFADGASLA